MPRFNSDGKLEGKLKCKWCGTSFIGYISTKYCREECKKQNLRYFGKDLKRESANAKRIRRIQYRKKQKEKRLCKNCVNSSWRSQRCKKCWMSHKIQDRIRKAKKDYGPYWEDQVLLLTIKDQIEEIENVAIKFIGQESKRHALVNTGAIEIWRNTSE